MICKTAQTGGIDIYNTLTLEVTKIIQQLRKDSKQKCCDIKEKIHLLSIENLESDADEEKTVNTIRNIKKDFTKQLMPHHSN